VIFSPSIIVVARLEERQQTLRRPTPASIDTTDIFVILYLEI